jgi:Domain of unknown function (DUF4333)
MPKGKRHVIASVITAVAGGWLVTGCSVSAHVSVGGTPAISQHNVEHEVATTLARQLNQPVPKVVCPGDLKAKIGTVMYCSLKAKGSAKSYPVKLRVNTVSGKQAHFSIVVSKTSGHFTAPS